MIKLVMSTEIGNTEEETGLLLTNGSTFTNRSKGTDQSLRKGRGYVWASRLQLMWHEPYISDFRCLVIHTGNLSEGVFNT